jgi:predicted metalloprotease
VVVAVLAVVFTAVLYEPAAGPVGGATSTPTQTTTPSTRWVPGPPDQNPGQPPRVQNQKYDETLVSSSLYNQTVELVDCSVKEINLATASNDAIATHMNEFVACLMHIWYGPLQDSGAWLPRPSVTVYDKPINTPCGLSEMGNAFYCTGDQQIYYARDLIKHFPDKIASMRFFSESIIAHEFAHAIQYRTGILESSLALANDADSEEDGWIFSRRAEMQADCMTGIAFTAIGYSVEWSSADRRNLIAVFNGLGGTVPASDDHGLGVNRAMWLERGLDSEGKVGACNTWTAPASEVD